MSKPTAKQILEFFISAILWIPGVLIVVICILFGLLRIFIHSVARLSCSDLIPINCPIDNIAILKPTNEKPRMNLSISCLLEGELDADLFRRRFHQVFLSSEELRTQFANLYCYYVKWGFFMFKKSVKTINLNERIVERTLLLQKIQDLEDYIGNYVELNDYGNNPNWQILLLHVTINKPDQRFINWNKNTHKSKTVFLLKMDHGLGDGYSVIRILDNLCRTQTPNPVKHPELTVWEKMYIFWQTPLNILTHLADLSRCDDIPWPHSEGGKKDEMYLSFGDLDMQRFKYARRLANCRFATLFGVLQVEVTKKYLASKKIHANIPEYAWVGAPFGWPNHPAIYGGIFKNHFTLFAFRVRMKSTDLVGKIAEAEEHYWKITRERKIPATLFSVLFPLLWGVPRAAINLVTDFGQFLNINSKQGLMFSSNFLPTKEYKTLGVNLQAVYPHTRIPSLVETPRLQIFQVSFGRYMSFCVGGRKDTFQAKEEVDYIAKTLIPETFEEILSALEESAKQYASIKDFR